MHAAMEVAYGLRGEGLGGNGVRLAGNGLGRDGLRGDGDGLRGDGLGEERARTGTAVNKLQQESWLRHVLKSGVSVKSLGQLEKSKHT